MSIGMERIGYTQAAMSAVRTAARQSAEEKPTAVQMSAAVQAPAAVQAQTDRVEISARGREEAEKAIATAPDEAKTADEAQISGGIYRTAEDETDETESSKTAVAFNAGKRARMLAAARTPAQVRQVLALLDEDLQECKAGLENGACGEEEVAKVEAMIRQARSKLAQVAGNDGEEGPGLSAFDLAGLM